jgi:Putative Flp pilus-assembly TadE/G-like
VTRARKAGQVLPFLAVCLGALMGFAGISVDVGFLEYRQQTQQSATDAAALGGAQQLVRSSCTNASNAESAATTDAASNGFTAGGNVTVNAHSPPQSGPYAGNNCAIGVQITTAHVQTFFSQLFGYPQGMSESTQAVAAVSANGNGCIYLLSTTITQNFNGANVSSANCGVYINYTANFNGATFKVPYIGYAGPAPNENGANFTEATPSPMLPVADPCLDIPGCAYLTANPPSTSSCSSFNGNGYNGALTPGCYSYLNLNGANVTMSGTYVLTGTSNFNGAHITGTGVTIYVTASGTPPNFNGANVTFTPPSTGNQAGVLYYQVPSNTASANFNGTSNSYTGLIYAPGATDVNFNGANGGYVVLVFGAVNFNGSAAQDFASPPPGQSLVTKAVIVE